MEAAESRLSRRLHGQRTGKRFDPFFLVGCHTIARAKGEKKPPQSGVTG
jgi:hypothetical protein